MILLVTDFGLSGPYIGQMMAALHRYASGIPVINLFADAPTHNPRATAYLLAAYADAFPRGSVFLSVVDPGVGSDRYTPVIVRAGNRWFVGPDNDLFNTIAKRRRDGVKFWEITWRPATLSASFHGRDLYAPVAAWVAQGDLAAGTLVDREIDDDWPDDLYEVVYVDHFGNAMTGIRGCCMEKNAVLTVRDTPLRKADTFASVPVGKAFWYENANGLVEIAVNQGCADRMLRLSIGDPVRVA